MGTDKGMARSGANRAAERGANRATHRGASRVSPPYAIGLLISVALHTLLAVYFVRNDVSIPRPHAPAPSLAPQVVLLLDRLPEAPPAVRIPPPARPIVRPEPPTEPSDPDPAAVDPLQPPEIIAHDVPPRLVNGEVVLSALTQGYPEDLPEEAANSRVLLWLFVDTSGAVTQLRVQTSSGYEALDQLAAKVAPVMSYSPALHQGSRVAVWVAQRILFTPPSGS